MHTIVGYTGGMERDPTYKKILDHTEAILVEYDPAVVSYEDMCRHWSKMIQDKLGKSSRQYRLAIWYLNTEQKAIAEQSVKDLLDQEGGEPSDVVAEPATKFYQAEEYHDHFLTSNAFRMKCFF